MKKYPIRVFIDAKSYISDIYEYFIGIKEAEIGEDILQQIKASIVSLTTLPLRHPLLDDQFLKSLEIRTQQVSSYLIFYKVAESEVQIVRILHEKRGWQDILKKLSTKIKGKA